MVASIQKFFGDVIGVLIAFFWPSRWRIAVENIQKCIPDQDVDLITMKTFKHFGRAAFEQLFLTSLTNSNRFIFEKNKDYHEFLRSKSSIVLTGHIGLWEILSIVVSKHIQSVPVHLVYQKLNNAWLNNWVVRSRAKNGITAWDRKSGLIPMIRSVKKHGGHIGIVADQGKGVKYSFFGMDRSFPDGPARLARKMKLPVYWMCCMREGNMFRVQMKSLDPDNIKEQYVEILEHTIRKYPEQYFWMHRLWKY